MTDDNAASVNSTYRLSQRILGNTGGNKIIQISL